MNIFTSLIGIDRNNLAKLFFLEYVLQVAIINRYISLIIERESQLIIWMVKKTQNGWPPSNVSKYCYSIVTLLLWHLCCYISTTLLFLHCYSTTQLLQCCDTIVVTVLEQYHCYNTTFLLRWYWFHVSQVK